MAERQGFEPWVPEGTTVFETAPIDHSGTFPKERRQRYEKNVLEPGAMAKTDAMDAMEAALNK